MNDRGSQHDRHVIMWRACNEIYQRLRLTPVATEPDEAWHAREMADARCFGRLLPRFRKGVVIVGGRVVDRCSDPTLALRVQEAERGVRVAHEILRRVYRDASDKGRLGDLPLPVRIYIQDTKAANGGRLPVYNVGRPRAPHRAFALAVAVEVERLRGLTLDSALSSVAKCARSAGGETRETIAQAHKDWRGTRKMLVELADRRKSAADAGLSDVPAVNLKALAELEPPPMPKPPRRKPK